MGDIDDLLDEVESKFCSDGPSSTSKVKSIKPTKKSSKSSNINVDNLNDIINDIIEDDGLEAVLKRNRSDSALSSNNSLNCSIDSKLKCVSIYIGGSTKSFGAASGAHQNPCDRLHCTSCDNKIVTFDDFKWAEADCDYLVFRNNYPDFSRLKSKLLPRKGFRSYCCQCSWLSVKDLLELRSYKPDFKWVCRKH